MYNVKSQRDDAMPKLLFQGHGSLRLTANDGRVIYVDPYAGKKMAAEKWDAPNKLIVEPGQEIDL